MNATPPRPRLYCRLVRTFSAPGPLPRHAASCADCQRYFHASTRLESALRRDAIRFAAPAPAGLERGIMQAIRAAQPAPAPVRSHAGWFAGAALAAAAVVAVAVTLFQQPSAVKPAGIVATPPAPDAGFLSDVIPDGLWNAVIPRASALVAANPLQYEIDSVYSDAHTAIDFLAVNFLPSSCLSARQAAQAGAKG